MVRVAETTYASGHRVKVVAKQANVEVTSWTRFDTPNLEITPALLGQSHVFTFDGHRIEISLPSADRLAGFRDAGDDPLVDRRISVVGWSKQDGRRQPREIAVHDVGVICNIPGRTSIPEEARTTPITHEYFSEEQKKHLAKLARDYGNLAYRAFDLWIRTLRWKADAYRIGTPEVSGVKATGWQSEIREKNSLNRFWRPLRRARLPRPHANRVSPQHATFKEAQKAHVDAAAEALQLDRKRK
jgi:hypothetical protein